MQIVTNQIYRNELREFADGGTFKKIRYTINCYLNISDNQLVKTALESNENIENLNGLNDIIKFIKMQDKLRNYPRFGDDYEVQTIYPEYDAPSTPMIDSENDPALAVYTIPVVCEVLVYDE